MLNSSKPNIIVICLLLCLAIGGCSSGTKSSRERDLEFLRESLKAKPEKSYGKKPIQQPPPTIHRIWEETHIEESAGARISYKLRRDLRNEGTEKISLELKASGTSSLELVATGINGYKFDGAEFTSYSSELTSLTIKLNGKVIQHPKTDERTRAFYAQAAEALQGKEVYRVTTLGSSTLELVDKADGERSVFQSARR